MSPKQRTTVNLTPGSLQALQRLAGACGFVLPKNLQRDGVPAGNFSLLLDALAAASEHDFDGLVAALKPFLTERSGDHV